MDDARQQASDDLQALGLNEYEAKCFVGLTQLNTATAKQLSDVTSVPRTRVYDAVGALETRGLVEVQQSSPQQYRAVPREEALETVRSRYEDRFERLETTLRQLETDEPDTDDPVNQAWTLNLTQAITNRSMSLVTQASEEIYLLLGHPSRFSDDLLTTLKNRAPDVDLKIGTAGTDLQQRVRDAVPNANTFVSTDGWLGTRPGAETELTIGRLLLVDRETLLVSTVDPATLEERAVVASGAENGLVVLARRLIDQGRSPASISGSA